MSWRYLHSLYKLGSSWYKFTRTMSSQHILEKLDWHAIDLCHTCHRLILSPWLKAWGGGGGGGGGQSLKTTQRRRRWSVHTKCMAMHCFENVFLGHSKKLCIGWKVLDLVRFWTFHTLALPLMKSDCLSWPSWDLWSKHISHFFKVNSDWPPYLSRSQALISGSGSESVTGMA